MASKCDICGKEKDYRKDHILCDTRSDPYIRYCEECLPPRVLVPCLGVDKSFRLINLANNTAFRFGAPIFLVGSAIDSEDPIDLDLTMPVFDKHFDRLISPENDINWEYHSGRIGRGWQRWMRFTMKQKEYFEIGLRNAIDVDFKIQRFHRFYGTFTDKPRIRLDFFTDFF